MHRDTVLLGLKVEEGFSRSWKRQEMGPQPPPSLPSLPSCWDLLFLPPNKLNLLVSNLFFSVNVSNQAKELKSSILKIPLTFITQTYTGTWMPIHISCLAPPEEAPSWPQGPLEVLGAVLWPASQTRVCYSLSLLSLVFILDTPGAFLITFGAAGEPQGQIWIWERTLVPGSAARQTPRFYPSEAHFCLLTSRIMCLDRTDGKKISRNQNLCQQPWEPRT